MSPEDVASVLAACWEAGESTDRIPTRRVPLSEIRRHDYDLNISRYIETSEATYEDFALALQRYRDAEASTQEAAELLSARLESLSFDA
jgi:type I restriction-modification system DNA methylase subunit